MIGRQLGSGSPGEAGGEFVFCRWDPIEFHVHLICVEGGGFVGEKVVDAGAAGTGGGWVGEKTHQALASLVLAAGGDHVAYEGLPGGDGVDELGGIRVKNGGDAAVAARRGWLTEVAAALRGTRYGAGNLIAGAFAQRFEVDEEEGLVAPDRAAEGAAKLVSPEIPDWPAVAIGEVVIGVHFRVAKEFVDHAAKLVTARLDDHVYDAAARTAVLGGVTVGMDLEFFQRVG